MPRSFLSSTVPASATSVATCWCCGVDTSVEGVAGSGLSNTPESNMANKMRRTASSTRADGIWPEVRSAAVSALGAPGRAARSTPAFSAATGLRTANPKSGTTNPLKPSPCLRSPSVFGFSQLGDPLIWL